MNYDIDFDELRKDLTDYYGTAAFSGYPAAIFDVSRVENASYDELINEASKNSFNLDKYKKQLW